jgi:error-prone DNA polymerase
MTEEYVEMHARSAFSFLEGASLPEELVSVCADLKMPAMALLDRNGVYGSPRFHLAAVKQGIRAHIGSEITIALPQFAQAGSLRHVTLPVLVETRKGYRNLCRLITMMKMRAPKIAKPGEVAATPEELARHAEGLICLTGERDGPLACALRGTSSPPSYNSPSGFDEAIRVAEWLTDVFGKGNVYAELQRHFNREEEARNHAVIEIARRLKLPLLATGGVCYATPKQRQLMDVFTCIHNHVLLENAGRLLAMNSERFLKSPAVMSRLFSDLPEAVAQTRELSSRLEFTLKDLGYEFPSYPVPPGETEMSYLRKLADQGARWRYTGKDGTPAYERARGQIEHELAIIEKLKLAGYFLIVWDIINFCRDNKILVQGRGSAANSAVCYSLQITAVDPVGMELLFERFLSEERGEWPDIDLDLPSGDQRERVIQYVYQRYGRLGAAMTANVITYRGRSAAREVGKVMGFDEQTVARLSSLVRTWEWKDPKDTPERQFRDAGLDLADPRIRKFFELYLYTQDLPRHLGQHSGGMVICQGSLDSVVPLEPATMPGRVVVQWDKEDCADLGIIKVDLLGLGMMAAIEECIQLISDHYGENVDLAHLPPDDSAVYAALQKADTIGMFQIESRAQMSCLPRLRPKKFYDIVVQVAIIRPGPIVGNMVHPYLNRRLGREEPTCLHPSLEPVLKRTLGVPLFQEQLLRMAMLCANFTGGEAEDLRRAMGFKRSEARMQEIEKKLRLGMTSNGIDQATQETIVQSITSFALYGFPESHAASFALIAYASAYLKCHYIAAFTAALLNNQPMGFYQPATLIKDAQRHGLRVLPVDVTRSNWECTVERTEGETGSRGAKELRSGGDAETRRRGDRGSVHESQMMYSTPLPSAPLPLCSSAARRVSASPLLTVPPSPPPALRLGMRYVKGLREETGRAIVREREQAPFVGIEDLRVRVPELRKDEMRKLAKVGALNFIEIRNPQSAILNPRSSIPNPQSPIRNTPSSTLNLQSLHRRSALWQVERAARPVGPLIEGQEDTVAESPLQVMTVGERMDADFRGTGLTIGRHPMSYHRAELDRRGVAPAVELEHKRNGSWVRVAGWVIVRQRPGTAKGFMFLTVEDETGIANVIVTPNMFDRNREALTGHSFLLIEGVLQHQDNVISVKGRRFEPLTFTTPVLSSRDFH